MKPLRIRLQEERKRLGLPWEVIERNYLLSWILAGISRVDSLRETLVFKGGTALKKCYFGDYHSPRTWISAPQDPCPVVRQWSRQSAMPAHRPLYSWIPMRPLKSCAIVMWSAIPIQEARRHSTSAPDSRGIANRRPT